jgi:hypothetical protein
VTDVFDTESLVACLYGEPDHETVGSRLGAVAASVIEAPLRAADRDATLFVGADDDFDSLPVAVTVERFHEHGV